MRLLDSSLALAALGAAAAVAYVPACSSSDSHASKRATAAVVAGPQDAHCTKTVTVNPAACKQGSTSDAGATEAGADAGGGNDVPYGPTMSNAEGDDDDCKYHLKWSATSGAAATTQSSKLYPRHGDEGGGSTAAGGDVTFTVTITNKNGGTPVTGAPVEIEAFLDDTHPAPNTTQTSKETSPGTYTVGPVRFDVSGKWTVRFHIHDECADSEESPHGHAAFFTQVTVN
jgi:hypothetical protein